MADDAAKFAKDVSALFLFLNKHTDASVGCRLRIRRKGRRRSRLYL
jgi:hypothetical protein